MNRFADRPLRWLGIALIALATGTLTTATLTRVASPRSEASLDAPDDMLYVAGGTYTPLYASPTDTAAALKHFATAHGLDPSSWTLLRGTKRDVRLLAALLGICYTQEADGQFSHTNLITVLHLNGEIAHQQRGLASDTTPSAIALHDVLVAHESDAP